MLRLWIILLLWHFKSHCLAEEKIAGQILLPQSPKVKRQPINTDEIADDDLKRLRDRRLKREKKEGNKKRRHLKSMTRRLDAVSKSPGPMRFFTAARFVLPYLVTTENKMENYYVDPSMFGYLYWKPFKREDPDNLELWLGFRLAPLAGAGIYDKTSGRFGFTYYGPMVGLGRISPAIVSLGKDEERKTPEKRKKSFNRSSVFWMGGIALQSRSGYVEKGREKPQDFDNQGVGLDVPGLWTEITYATVFYSRLGLDATFGLQLGKGKIFTYLGFGTSFWY